ncbi:MAG: hypothetical protein H0T51_02860 [Pirellulales bacterium]|nr:hypothetical protein [Pirellulales bacterium]
MVTSRTILLAVLAALVATGAPQSGIAAEPKGGDSSALATGEFVEQQSYESLDDKVRIHINSPAAKGEANAKNPPKRVMIYALPNGNTIEQTLGCKMTQGLDWHYDIQHVAAQTRLLREINPAERLVLVCAEAGGLSWPTWRGSRPDGNARIGKFLEEWRTRFGADAKVTLTGHSGGGSFIFGVIEAAEDIPASIDRIAMLDANYAFDGAKHAAKLVRWLDGDASRRLIVLAYDDRNIELNGKRVVGPDGGTFRATQRMIEAFKPDFAMTESQTGPFTEYSGLEGRVRFYVHPNPQNKILHTTLVGDMNGLVHAQTLGTPQEGQWGKFGGPRAYETWIRDQSEPGRPGPGATPGENPSPNPARLSSPQTSLQGRGIPARPADAVRGRAFMQSITNLNRQDREAAIFKEITAGNIPDFLRTFKQVPIAADNLHGTIEVMPDYLAIGSDEDFIRIPMTPQTAQRIAERFGCTLPTRKMVDAIDAAADVRLAPQPLTEDRESVAAFLLSNEKIEQQRTGKPLGALTIGAKKDAVLSPRIFERPDRVAIYGWRQLDGKPIQPLTTVHVNWYVDYSHGVRLVRDQMTINDKPASIAEVLQDPARAVLLSDEGPINPPRYPSD